MLDVLRALVERLQSLAEKKIAVLGAETSTCSREFVVVIDELDREITSLGERYGLKRVDVRLPVSRDDLRVALFIAEGGIVEIGLRGLNRCGMLGDLLGGELKPKAYGRVLGPGAKVVVEIEAEEKKQSPPATYFF